MDSEEKLVLLAEYVRRELASDEEDMRKHIRGELQCDPELDDAGALEQEVSARLYDIEGMEIDADPGASFDYGHVYAFSDVAHFIALLDADPEEALRILAVKREAGGGREIT